MAGFNDAANRNTAVTWPNLVPAAASLVAMIGLFAYSAVAGSSAGPPVSDLLLSRLPKLRPERPPRPPERKRGVRGLKEQVPAKPSSLAAPAYPPALQRRRAGLEICGRNSTAPAATALNCSRRHQRLRERRPSLPCLGP